MLKIIHIQEYPYINLYSFQNMDINIKSALSDPISIDDAKDNGT